MAAAVGDGRLCGSKKKKNDVWNLTVKAVVEVGFFKGSVFSPAPNLLR